MPGKSGHFAGLKEKALFGAAVAVLVAAAVAVVRWESAEPELPAEPLVPPPESAGAVAELGKLFSSGRIEDYWNESGRNIFVQPAQSRVFTPVSLEVPTLAPPRPPMPLPDPGPFLQHTGALPRLSDSTALGTSTATSTPASAPAPAAAPAPAPTPAPTPAGKPGPAPKAPAGGAK